MQMFPFSGRWRKKEPLSTGRIHPFSTSSSKANWMWYFDVLYLVNLFTNSVPCLIDRYWYPQANSPANIESSIDRLPWVRKSGCMNNADGIHAWFNKLMHELCHTTFQSEAERGRNTHTQAITTTHTPNHPYTTPQSPHTHHHTPYTTPLPIICAKNIRNSLYILSYLRLWLNANSGCFRRGFRLYHA